MVWIAAVVLIGCGEIREVEVAPEHDTSGSSGATTAASTSAGGTDATGNASDQDTDAATSTTAEATATPPVDPELHCGEAFVFATEGASPPLILDDPRTIAAVEVTVRLTHPTVASVGLALRRDALRRVLLEPDRIACGGELDAIFADDGELQPDEVCDAPTPVARVVPSESLDAFAGMPLGAEWTLEATGDETDPLAEVAAWCVSVRFAAE